MKRYLSEADEKAVAGNYGFSVGDRVVIHFRNSPTPHKNGEAGEVLCFYWVRGTCGDFACVDVKYGDGNTVGAAAMCCRKEVA